MQALSGDSRSGTELELSIGRQGRDSRRIGTIGWSMYRMHIGTIIVCVGSSTVPATGSFGWQYNASNGVVFRRRIGTAVVSFVGHGRLGRTCPRNLYPHIPLLAVLSLCLWCYRKAVVLFVGHGRLGTHVTT